MTFLHAILAVTALGALLLNTWSGMRYRNEAPMEAWDWLMAVGTAAAVYVLASVWSTYIHGADYFAANIICAGVGLGAYFACRKLKPAHINENIEP